VDLSWALALLARWDLSWIFPSRNIFHADANIRYSLSSKDTPETVASVDCLTPGHGVELKKLLDEHSDILTERLGLIRLIK
jgi:hypothetical protein